jgi:hypothetical protein
MSKTTSIIVGALLTVMFIIGISTQVVSAWLYWLDLTAAVLAFNVAFLQSTAIPVAIRIAAPVLLSLGLLAMWIVGLTMGGATWLVWSNFGVACIELAAGALAILDVKRHAEPTQIRRAA